MVRDEVKKLKEEDVFDNIPVLFLLNKQDSSKKTKTEEILAVTEVKELLSDSRYFVEEVSAKSGDGVRESFLKMIEKLKGSTTLEGARPAATN